MKDFLEYFFKLQTNRSHDNLKLNIVNYLTRNGFCAFSEYRVKDIIRKDKGEHNYKGRLDFYGVCKNIEVAGEIDHSKPRKKSILKCSKFPNALKIFILVGNNIRYFDTEQRIRYIKNYLVLDFKKHKVLFCDLTQKV